jgi:hypothetical protein
MPVGEMLTRTSSRELTEWAAYEREFGVLGPERGDLHASLLAYTVAAAAPRGKKSRRPRLKDFQFRWGTKQKQTSDEILALFQKIANAQKEAEKENEHDR